MILLIIITVLWPMVLLASVGGRIGDLTSREHFQCGACVQVWAVILLIEDWIIFGWMVAAAAALYLYFAGFLGGATDSIIETRGDQSYG